MRTPGIFGTDGIRGAANQPPMTADMALRLGAAAGHHFRQAGKGSHRVVIGKDTRLSGYMFENALTAGLTSAGMNVLLLGPVPTPAVALLTQSMRADAGIMISASHNPASDNGIKFFGPDGFKLNDAIEAAIEELTASVSTPVPASAIGSAKRIDDGRFRYVERVKFSFPQGMRLDGVKVVIDCANGADYRVAPEILWELGAEVVAIGVTPDGHNINAGVGATAPAAAAAAVIEHGADVGICLDGDGDRVLVVDEKGMSADGDQLMALLADRWAAAGRLKGGSLVATTMSNLGLERFLAERNTKLVRTDVGDRHVVARMRCLGCNLGGEQSGHIMLLDHATTGDGLIAGLQFLAAMVQRQQPASALARQFTPVPQILRNVPVKLGTSPLTHDRVQAAINTSEAQIKGIGRLLVRPSGTEPLIRVMGECEDSTILTDAVERVVAAVTLAGR